MKKLKMAVVMAFLTGMTGVCAGCSGMYVTNFGDEHYSTQDLKEKPFNKVCNEAVANVYYSQNDGDKYNVRVDYSAIKDKELCEELKQSMRIVYKDETVYVTQVGKIHNKNNEEWKVKVYITSPDLIKVNNEGVGNFYCENVNSDELKLVNEGVGSMLFSKILVNKLSVDNEGVGSVTLKKVDADNVLVENDGVGGVTLKDVTASLVKIDNDGVGSVSAHVNCNAVQATLDGVGSIKLSGVTHSLTKDRDGVGSIKTSNLVIKK